MLTCFEILFDTRTKSMLAYKKRGMISELTYADFHRDLNYFLFSFKNRALKRDIMQS